MGIVLVIQEHTMKNLQIRNFYSADLELFLIKEPVSYTRGFLMCGNLRYAALTF